MESTKEKYYLLKLAAQESGISMSTLYAACRNNRIECKQINNTYMISETALINYMENRKKRITVDKNISEMTIDDIAEELLSRINDAYERGKADGKKEAWATIMQAIKSAGKE